MLKRKILIVEDDEKVSAFVKTLLQDHEFGVDIASTGKEALEKVKHHPDLILLDRGLPDMDGLEVCRWLRDDSRFRRIPIIILSGRDSSEDKIEGLYIGGDDYITKPFLAEELVARIEVVLRRIQFAEQLKDDKEVLIGELKKIISEELITPFFQPIFSLKDYQPIGFEVLTRPPKTGLLNNPEFLFKVALSCGMYVDLEMLSWRKAFAQWKNSGRNEKVFLNCNPYLIESDRFDGDILKGQGIDFDRVVLELTERVAIQNYGSLLEKIDKFKRDGLKVAIDDVGCGFASLNTVAEVKPDFIKIDMPLIRSIHKDPLKQDIVRAIVYFSQRSKMVTIAEGIEEEAELKKVLELGVEAGQGYLLARPSQEISAKCDIRI